jgi:hypothetical protein
MAESAKEITEMNPNASFEIHFLRLMRDCSTYQFQYAPLLELEFHNKKIKLILDIKGEE